MRSLFRGAVQTTIVLNQFFKKTYNLFCTDSESQKSYLKNERKTISVLPGDGVGPELVQCVQKIFKEIGIPVNFEEVLISEINPRLSMDVKTAVEIINRNKVCLAWTLQVPESDEIRESIKMQIRKGLDLFANVVRAKSLPNLETRHKNVDIVIIREQTEGEFSAIEHEAVPGVIECYKIITRKNSSRIAKFAFDYATRLKRNKVTAVHKANIMKLGDGLFLRSCEEISKLYPKITFDNMIVDNACMQLVSNPHQFDVLVTTNLYGNIVDNLIAGLVGGAGVVPGESYSSDCVLFQSGARHTYAEAIGKNVANPTAMILTAAHLLHYINLHKYANAIEEAVINIIKDGKIRTKDIGGEATMTSFTNAVLEKIEL